MNVVELDVAIKNPKIYQLMLAAHEAWRQELDRQSPGKGKKLWKLQDCPWDLRLNVASVLAVLKELDIEIENNEISNVFSCSSRQIQDGFNSEIAMKLMEHADIAWAQVWERLYPNKKNNQKPLYQRSKDVQRLNMASLLVVLFSLGISLESLNHLILR